MVGRNDSSAAVAAVSVPVTDRWDRAISAAETGEWKRRSASWWLEVRLGSLLWFGGDQSSQVQRLALGGVVAVVVVAAVAVAVAVVVVVVAVVVVAVAAVVVAVASQVASCKPMTIIGNRSSFKNSSIGTGVSGGLDAFIRSGGEEEEW